MNASKPATPGKRLAPTASPCVQICTLDNDVCIGCGRTVTEIATWTRMSVEEKQAVWQRLDAQASETDNVDT